MGVTDKTTTEEEGVRNRAREAILLLHILAPYLQK